MRAERRSARRGCRHQAKTAERGRVSPYIASRATSIGSNVHWRTVGVAFGRGRDKGGLEGHGSLIAEVHSKAFEEPHQACAHALWGHPELHRDLARVKTADIAGAGRSARLLGN